MNDNMKGEAPVKGMSPGKRSRALPLSILMCLMIAAVATALVCAPLFAWAKSAPKPPQVTGISPAEGPTSGGTVVTISGSHFKDVTGVQFGGMVAANWTISGDTITATTPLYSLPATSGDGTVDVTVTTKSGTSFTYSKDQFSYYGPVVYSDSGYSTIWPPGVNTQSGIIVNSQTAYVECYGLTPRTYYTLVYKDGGGTTLGSDHFTAYARTKALVFPLTGYDSAQLGNWEATLKQGGGFRWPGSSSPECSPSPGSQASWYYAVNVQDIPEFPAWFTGIFVLGLCIGAYIWMRKRYLARVA